LTWLHECLCKTIEGVQQSKSTADLPKSQIVRSSHTNFISITTIENVFFVNMRPNVYDRFEIVDHEYGKNAVRMLHLRREGAVHSIREDN
jgi:hypothetical protein